METARPGDGEVREDREAFGLRQDAGQLLVPASPQLDGSKESESNHVAPNAGVCRRSRPILRLFRVWRQKWLPSVYEMSGAFPRSTKIEADEPPKRRPVPLSVKKGDT